MSQIAFTPPREGSPVWQMSVPLELLRRKELVEKTKQYLQFSLSRGGHQVRIEETTEALLVTFEPQHFDAHWSYVSTVMCWFE